MGSQVGSGELEPEPGIRRSRTRHNPASAPTHRIQDQYLVLEELIEGMISTPPCSFFTPRSSCRVRGGKDSYSYSRLGAAI